MHITQWIVLGTLGILGTGCGREADVAEESSRASEEPGPDVQEPASPHAHANFAPRILFLGDDLCVPVGVESYETFQSRVRLKLSHDGLIFRPVERCRAGRRAGEALPELEPVLIDLRPELVVLALGRADALAGTPVEEIETALEELILRARKAEARVLLLGASAPPGDGRYGGLFESLYPRLAEKHGIDFLPAFDRALHEKAGLWNVEARTPTARGHDELATALAPELSAIIRELGGLTND